METMPEEAARINELASAYKKSQVLFTALDAGVFPLLEEARTADAVAAALGWHPRGIRMLLDGLVALDLATKESGRYRNTPAASACLVPGGSDYVGHIVRHQHGAYDAYAGLADAVRDGGQAGRPPRRRTPGELESFILGMADLGRRAAQAILDLVDLSAYRNMLDVAGGPGTYSAAFVQRHEGLRATIMDRPGVIDIARQQIREAGLDGRFTFIAGDVLADDMGAGYDLILASNIIHAYGHEANRLLFKRCFAAMAPGGLLVINDFLVDDGRTGPPECLLFAIHMLVMTTTGGDTYTFADVEAWTRDAGFVDGRPLTASPRPRLWLARKP
ncbi:MAG: methyltransferase domain-containing protein [Candidatus Hydrogenedentes bacterium]|nr:methyltransferase domain-containing protein [Candidatus Hydrogenedentota bacterium]